MPLTVWRLYKEWSYLFTLHLHTTDAIPMTSVYFVMENKHVGVLAFLARDERKRTAI